MNQHLFSRPVLVGLVAAGLLAGGAIAAFVPAEKELRPAPADPRSSQVELLEARPFQLDAPEVHHWRAERPTYRAGYVLVLRTDPELRKEYFAHVRTLLDELYDWSISGPVALAGSNRGHVCVCGHWRTTLTAWLTSRRRSRSPT